MPPTKKRQFGDIGEKAAANYLKTHDYQILEMNYKNTFGRCIGEIDIIAKDKKKNELVFVEVKTRDYDKYKDTLPEENINYFKLKRLVKIANNYLKSHDFNYIPYRFDAISVWLDLDNKTAKIKHIPHL